MGFSIHWAKATKKMCDCLASEWKLRGRGNRKKKTHVLEDNPLSTAQTKRKKKRRDEGGGAGQDWGDWKPTERGEKKRRKKTRMAKIDKKKKENKKTKRNAVQRNMWSTRQTKGNERETTCFNKRLLLRGRGGSGGLLLLGLLSLRLGLLHVRGPAKKMFDKHVRFRPMT